jgi:hypothetical protein
MFPQVERVALIMNKEETALYNFMLDQDISIETVLDVIIKSNALVGVGIISLNDQVDEHLNLWIKYRGRS